MKFCLVNQTRKTLHSFQKILILPKAMRCAHRSLFCDRRQELESKLVVLGRKFLRLVSIRRSVKYFFLYFVLYAERLLETSL